MNILMNICNSNTREALWVTPLSCWNKLLDMYSDITKNGFVPMISFDQEKNAWAVKFKKDKMEFTVYLNRKDADACIDGTLCKDFGIQIAIDSRHTPPTKRYESLLITETCHHLRLSA